ncbi:MAG: hypothetical protein R2832_14995 [Rhodothermales bacterium]
MNTGSTGIRVGALGFSAGGHSRVDNRNALQRGLSSGRGDNLAESNRPDFMIRIPGGDDGGRTTHNGSRTYLLGDAPNDEMVMRFKRAAGVGRYAANLRRMRLTMERSRC